MRAIQPIADNRWRGSQRGAWYDEAVSWAVEEGIFSGNSVTGELIPTGNLTRAEAATVMMRLLS